MMANFMLCEFCNTTLFLKDKVAFYVSMERHPVGLLSERRAWQSSFLVESCLL